MPIQSEGTAPYAAAPAIIEVVEQYRHRGLQIPVTVDVLTRLAITENVAPRTLQALKLLELIDAQGQPTEAFDDLRRAAEADFQTRFAEQLRYVYADVFAMRDPAQDEVTKIRDAFRHYKPQTMQDRMVRLFYGLCEYAGIIEAVPQVSKAPARGSRPAVPRGRRIGGDNPTVAKPAPTTAASPAAQIPPARPGALKHELIAGLFRELPEPGESFPEARQEAWFAIAKATFRLIYNTTEPDAATVALELTPSGREG